MPYLRTIKHTKYYVAPRICSVSYKNIKKIEVARMNKQEIKSVYNLCYTDKYDIEELEERRLYINSEIDESVIDGIVYHILRYNREDKGISIDERRPIWLYINSPGGGIYDGYGLISAITASKTPVYTINQGMCASMGFLIFIAGAKRYSMENSVFLMHEGFTGGFDNTSKMRDRMEFETGQMEKHTKDYVLKHTSINSTYYDDKYRIEWYMLPVEAKENGICDAIVGVDCDIDEII